ncbi:MAG TPA: isoprenylcysteine carboxylmethyltransferase family protein [Gemmatimonadales bacterium]|nr:isoprenylcysteine carboxylmethyltransferase family protein [Gemmatimonadales bacterium]
MRPRQALVGSTVFFFAVPGVVAGALPWVIGSSAGSPSGWPMRTVGLALAAAGVALLVVCFAGFVAARGTPAPVAPTEQLVVEGPYRYVRNPMYVAVLTIVLGQTLWHASLWLVLYGGLAWAVMAAFVRLYEEPALRARFGSDYAIYRSAVPAWIPRVRPWPGPEVEVS